MTNFNGGTSGQACSSSRRWRSTNTIAVKLALARGRDQKVVEMAKRLGLSAERQLHHGTRRVGRLAAGAYRPVYAVFANGGKSVSPTLTEITNTRGEVLYSHDRDASPQVQIVSGSISRNWC
ncbi:MAG: hypothetical protein R3D33_15415 [Hyphomicrobiaceae bacterium]